MRSLGPTLTLLAVLAPLGAPPVLGADALQAHGDAGVLVLTQSPAGAGVHRPDGGIDAIALPPGAAMHSFKATTAGWTAAGTAPAGESSRLLIFARGSAGTREIPPPSTAGSVREPVLLGAGGRLGGLTWIEGNEVRAAELASTGWSASRTLARANSGTTMGLAGSVLADGIWLILWSAYDGEDDEIYWTSRARSGEWTPPARLAADNAVPDITPAVRPVAGGALAAWSRYDGNEYELVLSSFGGTAWTAPRRIAGAGALRPSFPDLGPDFDGAPLLLYRTARPRGWAVLKARAPFPKIARSSAAHSDRPVVELRGASARLVWSGGDTSRSN